MDSLKINICNEALARISASRIQRLDEPATEARACAGAFDRALYDMLASANWDFARKISTMALLRQEGDGTYVYQKPKDCLSVINVLGACMRRFLNRPAYSIYGDEIYCRIKDARIEYITKEIELDGMPPLFRTALAHRLAADIAKELTADMQLATMQYQLYAQILAEAKQKNALQSNVLKPQSNPYVECR